VIEAFLIRKMKGICFQGKTIWLRAILRSNEFENSFEIILVCKKEESLKTS